jgi:hypothetical protein
VPGGRLPTRRPARTGLGRAGRPAPEGARSRRHRADARPILFQRYAPRAVTTPEQLRDAAASRGLARVDHPGRQLADPHVAVRRSASTQTPQRVTRSRPLIRTRAGLVTVKAVLQSARDGRRSSKSVRRAGAGVRDCEPISQMKSGSTNGPGVGRSAPSSVKARMVRGDKIGRLQMESP